MIKAGKFRFRWPLRDVQQDIPAARCTGCGGEIYDYDENDSEDGPLCPECRAVLEQQNRQGRGIRIKTGTRSQRTSI